MEKITKYFKYCYANDTTVEYVNTGLYSMLNCSYTSEDPDYGTDTIHFAMKENASMERIAYEIFLVLTRSAGSRMDIYKLCYVPEGYDGLVLAAKTDYDAPDAQGVYFYDTADEDTLFFRLAD